MSNISGRVAVFWDLFDKKCISQTCSGSSLVGNISRMTHEYGAITMFRAYMESPGFELGVFNFRTELQSSGVCFMDCSNAEAKNNMIIVDMFSFAIDISSPATIVLITENRNLTYGISMLRLRRYNVMVIPPSKIHGVLKDSPRIPAVRENNVPETLSEGKPLTSRNNFSFDSTKRETSFTVPNLYSGSASTWRKDPSQVSSQKAAEYRGIDGSSRDPKDNTELNRGEPSMASVFYPVEDKTASIFNLLNGKNTATNTPDSLSGHATKDPINKGKSSVSSHTNATSAGSNIPHATRVEPRINSSISPCRGPGASSIGQESHCVGILSSNTFAHSSSTSLSISRSSIGESRPSSTVQPVFNIPSFTPSVSRGVVPPEFEKLVEILRRLRSNGQTQPLRSVVGSELAKYSVYKKAGAQNFSQYISMADAAGIVELGDAQVPGREWISLHRHWY